MYVDKKKLLWALITRKRFLSMGPCMNMHVVMQRK